MEQLPPPAIAAIDSRRSVIIFDFATKSSFFMLLGAVGLKKSAFALVVGFCAVFILSSCGGYNNNRNRTPSHVTERVMVSQGVTTGTSFGAVYIVNGQNDTIPGLTPLSAGSAPGLMTLSPTRNIAAAFDASSNTVFGINTVAQTSIGSVRLSGPTSSMVIPNAIPIGYAAVPSATVPGFSFIGAIDVMNFSSNSLTTIAVSNAQSVFSNANGTQLLVLSNDSDSITLISPQSAVPPVDTSCQSSLPNAVCTVVPGFDRPVYAVISGGTAYIMNCGLQCGGTQASVSIFDLASETITSTIPVDAATIGFASGSTLYVAGTPTTNNACDGQTTAATVCGRLDLVDLGSQTVVSSAVITDGFHQRMDMTTNGQLFIGSKGCTSIGDVHSPSGEVRGCLSIYKTADGSVIIPPDNGTVDGLQGFISRNVEYVAEGGALRVYDTNKDILLINNFLPEGSINIPGYIGDVKAIDFF